MNARTPVAVTSGCLFMLAYVAAAMVLSDRVMGLGTAAQLAYFAVAGCLWVVPITWLMVWAARTR